MRRDVKKVASAALQVVDGVAVPFDLLLDCVPSRRPNTEKLFNKLLTVNSVYHYLIRSFFHLQIKRMY